MKALAAGWFSFEQMGASAGDLLTRDLACQWLQRAGCSYGIAVAPPFTDGVDWRSADPEQYTHVVFVCGPFGNGEPITEFLSYFAGRQFVGLNLTMLQALNEWNPFDLLLERDSSVTARPDLVFLTHEAKVPVVGLILVHPQKEYKKRAMHTAANDSIQRLLSSRNVSVVPIDTRLDVNTTGLRTPAQVESLIARMDVVVTTRLHGTVLALKNGVPALAVDPIAGGAKILHQVDAIAWPVIFTADQLSDEALQEAFDYCLTKAAREKARECSTRAERKLIEVQNKSISAMEQHTIPTDVATDVATDESGQ